MESTDFSDYICKYCYQVQKTPHRSGYYTCICKACYNDIIYRGIIADNKK